MEKTNERKQEISLTPLVHMSDENKNGVVDQTGKGAGNGGLSPVVDFRRRLFLAVALMLFIYGFANYTGFCFREMHYLSDSEKLNNAMRHFGAVGTKSSCYKVGSYAASGGNQDRIECIYPYGSLDEFVQKNPGCCKLIKGTDNRNEDGPPRFADRVFGVFNYVVEAEFIETKSVRMNISGSEADIPSTSNYPIPQEKNVRRRAYFGNCGDSCNEVRENLNVIFSLIVSILGTCCYMD